MCYSAMIHASYRKHLRHYSADISLDDFYQLYWLRNQGGKQKIPKAMDAPFLVPENAEEKKIKGLIDEFTIAEANRIEEELFKQRARLADAERKLNVKETKSALESKRIASDKVSRSLVWLADLKRTDLKDRDSRIYPGHYAPVMVMEAGKRVIKPMRYQCRPAGKPAIYDTKYPGTYNARRDNLEGFWKNQFGHSHGIMMATAFYENVARDGKNVVLEFKPRPQQEMLIACLWSRWTSPGEPDLLSFAAITDEPPVEIAAAGHDRCIVPIREENIDAWLNPDSTDLGCQYAILDDRERPYYEHRLAA